MFDFQKKAEVRWEELTCVFCHKVIGEMMVALALYMFNDQKNIVRCPECRKNKNGG